MTSRRRLAQLSIFLMVTILAWIASSALRANNPLAELGGSANASQAKNRGEVTLSFAGDVHFEQHLQSLLDEPGAALSDIAPQLSRADVSMVNLETALTTGGTPEPKEYNFRTAPQALKVLDAAGVDLVTMANNHGADYGPEGLSDTLRAKADSPLPIIGVGSNSEEAYAPYRVEANGTKLAFFAADAVPLEPVTVESGSKIWTAGPDTPGLAAARDGEVGALVDGIRSAKERGEVAVVYLHWGEEKVNCPPASQTNLAQELAAAGADIVVGSHAHVLLGSGWLDDTYVNYGLGNFVWYHDHSPETGVLTLTLRAGKVVQDHWAPARIPASGVPYPVTGEERKSAREAWHGLRECTNLAAKAPAAANSAETEQNAAAADDLPAFTADISEIDDETAARVGHYQEDCPVALADLRYLTVSYYGFDDQSHTGELIVHEDYAEDVVGVFDRLYSARYPIAELSLVDEYGADDETSMAANNSTGFHCRSVAGSANWSDHAFGAAIDLNPVQNPYVSAGGIEPTSGAENVDLDRSPGAELPRGVVGADDLVVQAFADIGWSWGGDFTNPDFQHFYAPRPA